MTELEAIALAVENCRPLSIRAADSADVERGALREHAEWHLAHVRTNIAPRIGAG
jgi:hypothetical protein